MRELQAFVLPEIQHLDDCLTSQQSKRNPVLVGESRQHPVFTVLEIHGDAILCGH